MSLLNNLPFSWKNSLNTYYSRHPLRVILFVALFVRLLAAVYSRGYGMHDDHFLVIEPAQAWLDHVVVPGGESVPDGHSLTYMGAHYLLFKLLQFFGIFSPAIKMLIVRLIHALLSVMGIYFAYCIIREGSGQTEAKLVSWLLSLLWFMPMLSVRNLVETACTPFIIASFWALIRQPSATRKWFWALLAGLLIGIAINVRFQVIVIAGGMGLVLWLQRRWRASFWFTLGAVCIFCVMQGLVDQVVWGRPFVEFIEYVRYNLHAAYDYITGPWYNYILLLAGILIPPVSFFLLAGFFASWRKHLMLFLPAFLFLVFHSFFPNKQERFIFPIIPLLVMAGVLGWRQIVGHYRFWQNHARLLRNSWVIFWTIDLLLLIPVTFAYSKRSRVEAALYLQHYPQANHIIMEEKGRESTIMLPLFYSKHWPQVQGVTQYDSMDMPISESTLKPAEFVFFCGEKDLDLRVANMQNAFPALVKEAEFQPGLIDWVMFRLNPVNRNEVITLYRNDALIKPYERR